MRGLKLNARASTLALICGALTGGQRDAAPYRPDTLILLYGTTYRGDNIYNRTGAHQTKFDRVIAGGKAVYRLRVENDGTATEALRVTGAAGAQGWIVMYYNAWTGGGNITERVTGGGWGTGLLAPGMGREIRVEVRAAPGTPVGLNQVVLVTATSVHRPDKQDAVRAVTTVASVG